MGYKIPRTLLLAAVTAKTLFRDNSISVVSRCNAKKEKRVSQRTFQCGLRQRSGAAVPYPMSARSPKGTEGGIQAGGAGRGRRLVSRRPRPVQEE